MVWSCPKKNCNSKLEPEHIHFKVKEILMVIKVFCPGCKLVFKYEEMLKHALQCYQIGMNKKVNNLQLLEMINLNLHKQLGLAPTKKTAFSNEIFILDKDNLILYVLHRLTGNFSESPFVYDPEPNQPQSLSKQTNKPNLPHNHNYV